MELYYSLVGIFKTLNGIVCFGFYYIPGSIPRNQVIKF